MIDSYHIPVLLKESIDGLNIDPKGVYVDVTFGGGGHSIEILKRLNGGKLIVFDQDEQAEKNAEDIKKDSRFKGNFIFFRANFRYVGQFLRYAGISKIDGLFADLGVSSHQFDMADRGFSFRLGGIPDMRMNTDSKLTAGRLLNTYSEEQLVKIFKEYGEILSAKKLAREIVLNREIKDLEHLNMIIKQTIRTKKENKILAQIYQALRIEVNDEISNLKLLMKLSAVWIKTGGRLVVISYHSLEDRIVKNFIKTGELIESVDSDIYGKSNRIYREVRKLIIPEVGEIESNNRARSAKLRIAEKL
jgi:16S rRNA (cytosine1402-N4)-methyltransferase